MDPLRNETTQLYKVMQFFGLLVNGYYLVYMVMLNVWFGQGITPLAIWRQLLFMTNLNHILIFVYHAWSFILAVQEKERPKYLRQYYQFLFNLSTFVTVIYWIMRSIDQKLIHGKHTASELGEMYFIFIHGCNHFLLFYEIFVEDKYNEFESSFKQFFGFSLFYACLTAIQQFYFRRSVYGFYSLIKPFGFLVPLTFIPILMIIDKFYTQKIFKTFRVQLIEYNQYGKQIKKD